MGRGQLRMHWQRVRPWGERRLQTNRTSHPFSGSFPPYPTRPQVKEKVGRMVEKGCQQDSQWGSCSLSSLWNKILNLRGKEWNHFQPQGTDEIPLRLRGKGNFKKCWILSERQEYVLGSELRENCTAVGNIPGPEALPHPMATPRLLVRIFTPKS